MRIPIQHLGYRYIPAVPPPPPPPFWSATQTRASYGGLCEMPVCGQAVGYSVCDTPELWRGAAGLCARVRACAGAAESLHTYIYILRAQQKIRLKEMYPEVRHK